jgi:hypothetical protein
VSKFQHHTVLYSKCSISLVSSLNLSPICWWKEQTEYRKKFLGCNKPPKSLIYLGFFIWITLYVHLERFTHVQGEDTLPVPLDYWRWYYQVPTKHQQPITQWHNVTPEENRLLNNNAVRTSRLTSLYVYVFYKSSDHFWLYSIPDLAFRSQTDGTLKKLVCACKYSDVP